MFKINSDSFPFNKPPVSKINVKESLLEDPISGLRRIIENPDDFKKLKLREDPYFVSDALNSAIGEQIKKILVGDNTSPEGERNAKSKLWVLLRKAGISPEGKAPGEKIPYTYKKSEELIEILKTIKKPEGRN